MTGTSPKFTVLDLCARKFSPATLAALPALIMALMYCLPVYAQTQNPDDKKPVPDQPKPVIERAPPPYESKLLRLSEIMGSLAYLHALCDLPQKDVWRNSMATLLAAEAKTAIEKARLAGAYNNGYRGFQYSYRVCTPNARLVVDRYLKEGEKIAQDVANRYGGG